MKPTELKCPYCGSKEMSYDYTESTDFDRSSKTLEITTTFQCGECDEYSRHWEKYKVGELLESSLDKA
jgi:DNA-directed RNA polymerase subunit M/transcription elongation factor TFIIS